MNDLISRADAIEALRKVVVDNDVVDALKALPSAEYGEADGVITIEKQSAKDVGEIKHVVIHSPNYTRYFYNESMPTSAEVANLKQDFESADAVKVAYICDGRKCVSDCSECFRTLDIEHAKDFKLMGDTYFQQEAEAVQGEWKQVETRTYKGECTNCGFRHIFMDGHDSQYRFCPNCGAKMTPYKGGDE